MNQCTDISRSKVIMITVKDNCNRLTPIVPSSLATKTALS